MSSLIFCLLALVWTAALYAHLLAEDDAKVQDQADQIRALFNLPDLAVLDEYPERYFDQVADMAAGPLPKSRVALGETLSVVLAVIAKMAQDFSEKPAASYGASLMLVVNKGDIGTLPDVYRTPYRADETGGRLRFAGHWPNVMDFDGLLVLPDDLAVMDLSPSEDGGGRTYPLISLPVNYAPPDLILPGAPTAVLSRDLSVYRDTSELAEKDCKGFSAPTRGEVGAYFAAGGGGESVRSLASIRIDSGDAPVGVLNIDSSETDVLGVSPEYYPTFVALLRPLLRVVEPIVKAYAVAWWAEVALDDQAPPAQPTP